MQCLTGPFWAVIYVFRIVWGMVCTPRPLNQRGNPFLTEKICYLYKLVVLKSLHLVTPSPSLHLYLILFLRSAFTSSNHRQQVLRSAYDNQPTGTATTFRGHVWGRLRTHGTAWQYSRPRYQLSLFLRVVSLTDGQIITSAALKYRRAVDAKPSPWLPVNVLRSEPTSASGNSSQLEGA